MLLGIPASTISFMSESQSPNPRKRQRTEPSLQRNETLRPASKRQKRSYHLDESHPPPVFWDNLSKIWLTKDALRELDRRNAQIIIKSPRSPYRRPVTRTFLTEWKRNHQLTQSADDYFRPLRSFRSFRWTLLKDIKLFARHGGPDLSDLRGFPEPFHLLDHSMNSSYSSSRSRGQQRGSRGRKLGSRSASKTGPTTTNTKDTGAGGAYNTNFQQNLIDRGIYPYSYEYPNGQVPPKPDNWADINQRLARPQPSLSLFPDEKFEEFVRADARANNEDAVKDSVIPKLLNTMGGPNGAQRNIRFTNLALIDGFEEGDLKKAQPDYYYGAPPEQLNQEVRNKLSNHIIPSTSTDLPIAPNYFIEAKGPNGSFAVSTRQACFDGMHGTRAMQTLQSYGQGEPVYDNNAYTLSGIYHAGQLRMYSHHATQPNGAGTRVEYHMHHIGGWSMVGDKDSHVRGLAALRNAGDWTKEMRDAAIARANQRADQMPADEGEEEAEEEEGETEDEEDETEDEEDETEYEEEGTEYEEEGTEDEEEETDDKEVEAESSSTKPSSAHRTETTLPSLIDDKDSDTHESESSIDELQRDYTNPHPPAKRSSSNSHHSRPGKRWASSRRTG